MGWKLPLASIVAGTAVESFEGAHVFLVVVVVENIEVGYGEVLACHLAQAVPGQVVAAVV